MKGDVAEEQSDPIGGVGMPEEEENAVMPHFVRRLLVVVWVISGAAFASGQAAPAPSSPDIAGYVHFSDPYGLTSNLATWLERANLTIQPFQLRALLGGRLGDPKFGLISPGQPLMFVWLLNDDGQAAMVVVLPEVADTFYLNECARRTERQSATAEGLSFIGSAESVARATALASDLKTLHQAVHPAAISCYFTAAVWPAQFDSGLAFFANRSLRQILTDFLSPAATESGNATPTPTASPKEEPSAARPFTFQVLSQIAREAEETHFLIDFDESGARVVLNVSARAGTPLAGFCDQPAADTNPLARYLPAQGWFRACFFFAHNSLVAFAKDEISQAALSANLSVDRTSQMLEKTDNLLFFSSPGALCLGGATGAGAPLAAVIGAPQPDDALDHLQKAVESCAFLRGSPSVKQISRPTPVKSLARRRIVGRSATGRAAATSASTETARGGIELDKSNLYEGFVVYRFYGKSAARASGANPLMSAFFADTYLTASTNYDDLTAMLGRCLRLQSLQDPLEAQATFLDGANLYADLRLDGPGLAACGGTARVVLAARMTKNRVQLAAGIPYAALAGLVPPPPTPTPTPVLASPTATPSPKP